MNSANSRVSCITTAEDVRCRACIKAAASYQSLQQTINNMDTQSKTYGELLKDLLQLDYASVLEDQLPQKICKKCASLLKKVHIFVLEARKRHEELLRCINDIKSEDCLQEMPIDLLQLKEIEIKAEPEPHTLLELVEVHIKTEPVFVETSHSKNERAVASLNTHTNLNNANVTEENTLSNFDLENLSNDATDVSSAAEDDVAEVFSLPQKSLAVRCDVCDKVYDNAVALKKHKTYTHMPEEQKIPCALCNFKTSRTSAIKVHLRTIHGPETVDKYFKPRRVFKGSFCCTSCPKRYSRKDDLQRHIKKVHINGENLAKKPKPGQKSKKRSNQTYLCTFCGQSFAEKGNLSIHVRTHTGDRPFKCEFCEKAFRSSETLKYHLVTHSDEKPHTCSECGKSFKRKDKLRTHMRVHSELRPYKCSECEKSFKYSCVLKTHMHIHTGQTPFACKTCGESFSLRTSLNVHCVTNGHEQ